MKTSMKQDQSSYENKHRKSDGLVYLFYHSASFKRPTNTSWLACSSNIQEMLEQSSWHFCHYCLGQFDPLNFLFSERFSFSLLDSRKIPWERTFWQGTLYPSNNLEQSKPWFRLIKQKSVKMIGSSFIGIKFVMLNLMTCIRKNCSLLQKFNLHFRPKSHPRFFICFHF